MKIGIIGYGGMAGHHHTHIIPVFNREGYPEVVEVKGVYDINPARCELAASRGLVVYESAEALLSDEERQTAANIYRVLNESRTLGLTVQQTHDYVVNEIDAIPMLEVQYFNIVDGDTLADVSSWDEAQSVVGCITVFCGEKPIRLIDHIRYK